MNKKTILLSPYAQTSEMLPLLFWKQLAERLVSQGYTVYTNVKNETESEIEGTERMCETLNDTALFVSAIGGVIALRSGLCDVLAYTQTQMITIDTNQEYFKNWNLTKVAESQHVTSLLYEGLKISSLCKI